MVSNQKTRIWNERYFWLVGLAMLLVLPKYRRLVEQLFQQRLLSVCVCTETLAAGTIAPDCRNRAVLSPASSSRRPGPDRSSYAWCGASWWE